MARKCYWNPSWKEHEEFKDWIREDSKGDLNKAYCSFCCKDFSLSSMGAQALRSHASGKRHKEIAERNSHRNGSRKLTDMYRPVASTANDATATPSTSTEDTTKKDAGKGNQPSVKQLLAKDATLKAEILWALRASKWHLSFNSNEDLGTILRLMFPHSEEIRNFSMGATKCQYMSTFGIAPYIRSELKEHIKGQPYVLMFDESLNEDLQKKQMDIHVRYWKDGQVCSRYFTSVFMGHASAADLLDQLLPVCSELGGNLLQLSMDGPNVNWALFNLLNKELYAKKKIQLISVGSCGLHTVHNAFQAGSKASGWEMEQLLSALYRLFKCTPARRQDFQEATGCQRFPRKFCKHRWLENVPVAERALEVWPHIIQYVKLVQSKDLPDPGTQSFSEVVRHVQDKLVMAKLHAFISLARTMNPFLLRFQGDAPLLPFLASELTDCVRGLLGRIYTSEARDKYLNSPGAIASLEDVKNSELFRDQSKFDLGILSSQELRSTNITTMERLRVRLDFKQFVLAIVDKLLEKSPLAFSLVRAMDCLRPPSFLSGSDLSIGQFNNIVSYLHSVGQIPSSATHDAPKQFADARVAAVSASLTFKRDTDRLDKFWWQVLESMTAESDCLRDVLMKVLVLSHGQAGVERGFSVNNHVSVVNLKEQTLVAQRQICDFVAVAGGVDKINIEPMMTHARQAHQRYKAHLEMERKKKTAAEKNKELEKKKKKMESLQTQIEHEESLVKDLNKTATEFAFKAEQTKQFSWVTKSNSLRRTAEEKKKLILSLQQELKQLRTQ